MFCQSLIPDSDISDSQLPMLLLKEALKTMCSTVRPVVIYITSVRAFLNLPQVAFQF